jgi:hypothetical protein
MSLVTLDERLLDCGPRLSLSGLRRFVVEFFYFGIKEARATVILRPLDRDRNMPLLLAFVLIGFFIWLAENVRALPRGWSPSICGMPSTPGSSLPEQECSTIPRASMGRRRDWRGVGLVLPMLAVNPPWPAQFASKTVCD